jgi:hypothetical protein
MGKNVVRMVLIIAGMASTVPSAAAVNPMLERQSYAEDDLTGSGREARAPARNLASRRAARLRIRFDAERAALLGILDKAPTLIGECFPEFRTQPAAARLLLPMIRAMFELRTLSMQRVVSETGLPIELVARTLDRFAEAGLVSLTAETLPPEPETLWISPTPELRHRGRAFTDRVYRALDSLDLS